MKRIIVVGGGVGGLVLATRLGKKLGKKDKARVTLIDQNSHHFWKPLLHEIASGARNAYVDGVDFRTQGKLNHFKFRQGSLLSVEREQKTVTVSSVKNEKGEVIFPESTHEYDVLVLAMGSVTNDFGTPGVKEHCTFLNDYLEAEKFRQHMLETLYKFSAEMEESDRQINVSIVGGGATGVELAAELIKMADKLKDYGVAKINPERLNIKILEASNRILPAVPEEMAKNIKTLLEKMGIQVITNSMITKADEKGFYPKGGELIESDIMVWTAGVKAEDYLKGMGGLESSRANQFMVKPTLQTTKDDSVFALGDCAAYMDEESKAIVPPTAQAAAQMSKVCADNIIAYFDGKPMKSFKYNDKGTIVTIAHTAQGVVSTMRNKKMIIKGTPAYTMHYMIYYAHQAELYGLFRSWRLGVAGKWFRKVKSSLDLPTKRGR